MRPVLLKVENFGLFIKTELKFRQKGLILVEGNDVDSNAFSSNGSGKSTIFQAIEWCLYGKSAKGLKGDGVVNDADRKLGRNRVGCKVDFIFDHGKTRYMVRRYKSRTGVDDITGEKAKDIVLLFHWNKNRSNSFWQIVPGWFGNKDAQKMINDLIGMSHEIYTTAIGFSNGLGNFATATDAERKKILDEILKLNWVNDAKKKATDKLAGLKDDLHLLNMAVNTSDNQIDVEDGKIEILEDALREHIEEINNHKKVTDYKIADNMLSMKALIDKIKSLVKPKLRLTKLNLLIDEELIDQIEESIDKVSRAMNKLKKPIIIAKNNMKRIKLDIENFNKLEDTCPTCYYPLEEMHASVMLDKLNYTLKQYRLKFRTFKTEYQDLGVKLQHYQTKMQVQTKLIYESKLLIEQLKPLPSIQKQLLNYEQAIENIKSLSYKSKVTERQQVIKMARIRRTSYRIDKYKYLQYVDAMNHKIDLVKFWIDAFSNTGIKSFILDSVLPDLNTEANNISNILTDGEIDITFDTESTLKSGENRDKFTVICSRRGGGTNYSEISDGEKKRATICVIFALHKLVLDRMGNTIPFLILDEIFESVDKNGAERVIELLRKMASDKTIYVITHQDNLKQHFGQSIQIVRENGVSRIA